jgi:hypothetical protein
MNYSVTVNNIENPEDTGYARFLQIALYDFESNQVLAKSFSNLNKAVRSSFQESGADIIINY